jgi:hypothetical protein
MRSAQWLLFAPLGIHYDNRIYFQDGSALTYLSGAWVHLVFLTLHMVRTPHGAWIES